MTSQTTIPTPREIRINQGTNGPQIVIRGKLLIKIAVAFVIFLAGILLGNASGHSAADHHPDNATIAILHYAQTHTAPGESCWAEWRVNSSDYEVICGKVTSTPQNFLPNR